MLNLLLFVTCIYFALDSDAFSNRPQFVNRRVNSNKNTINDLLIESRKYGNYTKAINQAQSMLLSIDTISCSEITKLIQIFGESGRLGDALNVLRQMDKASIIPNEYHLSALIQACRKANQWEMALSIYERSMKPPYNVQINSITGNCMLSTLADARQFELALEIFSQLKKMDLLTEFSYSAMIIACEREGNWLKAVQIYRSMYLQKCIPNTITFNNVLKACINNGQFQIACDLFYDSARVNTFSSSNKTEIVGDAITYSLIITAHGNLGQYEQAWNLFNSMDGEDDDIDNNTTNSFKNIPSRYVKKDTGVYNAMISTYNKVKNWKKVLFLLDCMGVGKQITKDKVRVYPDIKTYTSVINCLGETDQWQEAYQVFQRYNCSQEGLMKNKDNGVYYSIISTLQIACMRYKVLASSSITTQSPSQSLTYNVYVSELENLIAKILQDTNLHNDRNSNRNIDSNHFPSKTYNRNNNNFDNNILQTNKNVPYATEGIDPSDLENLNIVDLHGLPYLVAQAQVNSILKKYINHYQNQTQTQAQILTRNTYQETINAINLNLYNEVNSVSEMNNIDITQEKIQQSMNIKQQDSLQGLLLITGRGNHINTKGTRRVLRPEIEIFLRQHYNDLELTFPNNNDGCILIQKDNIFKWLERLPKS